MVGFSGVVKRIVIVADNATDTTGTVTVDTKNLKYVPSVTPTTDALTDFEGKAKASGIEPCSVNTNPCPAGNVIDTVTSFVQTSGDQYSFGYDLRNGTGDNRWAASAIELESARDLTVVNSSIVLGVTSTSGNFIVEVQDNSTTAVS